MKQKNDTKNNSNLTEMEQQYKYFAFISYNSKDTAWGKRLQKKLEHYRMPSTLCSEHGWEKKPIKPVFFAPTDIQPGGLSEELQERLKASQHLIVICSPNSAKSQWVGREIEFFHNLGRTKNIHFFIVEGSPHSGNPGDGMLQPRHRQVGVARDPRRQRQREDLPLAMAQQGSRLCTTRVKAPRRGVRRHLATTQKATHPEDGFMGHRHHRRHCHPARRAQSQPTLRRRNTPE